MRQARRETTFTGDDNPFLALLRDGTSAHPAAFEPMTLAEIQKAGCNPETETWQKFYEPICSPSELAGTRPRRKKFQQHGWHVNFCRDRFPTAAFSTTAPSFRNRSAPVSQRQNTRRPEADLY